MTSKSEVAPAGQASPPSGYVPALAGVRALAALLVVFFHLRFGFSDGDIGVDIFFVLSGFLITGILLRSARRGRVGFKTFYWRRALRLLPVYFAVLVVSVTAAFIWNLGNGTLRGAGASLFYISNWIVGAGHGLGLLAHTWSLSIEEQFYLLWPIGLVLILRWSKGIHWRSTAATAGLLVLGYLSVVLCWMLGASEEFTWNFTPGRGMELLFGCLLALVLTNHGEVRLPSRLRHLPDVLGMAAVVGLILIANFWNSDMWGEMLIQWPAVALLAAALVFACVTRGGSLTQRLLSLAPLVVIGKVSYGLYLWHFPVLYVVDATLGLDSWGPRLIAIAVTAVIVPLSYRYIEMPFLRLKDRPSAAGSTATSGSTPRRDVSGSLG